MKGSRRLATALLGVVVLGVLVVAARYEPEPEPDHFTVANGTDETIVVWGRELVPGVSREFEIDADTCADVTVYSRDLRRAAKPRPTCGDDEFEVRSWELRALHGVRVVNETDSDVYLLFDNRAGSSSGTQLQAGAAVTLDLFTGGECIPDVVGQPALSALVGDDPQHVYHWGEICDGSRWVVDEKTLAAGSAVVTVVNDTERTLSLRLSTDLSRDIHRVSPGGTADLPLGVPQDQCLNTVIRGEDADDGATVPVQVVRKGILCDEEITLTAADLVPELRPAEES